MLNLHFRSVLTQLFTFLIALALSEGLRKGTKYVPRHEQALSMPVATLINYHCIADVAYFNLMTLTLALII